MTSDQIRQKYLKFFADRGHAVIPSAPLVPENDPTTLFTSSGMQPLVPYLLGQKHPAGKRLVNSQKSFRAQDIEEVGDNRHTTFFEMLGNWSLGDYFKKEQLPWIFEFLTKELELPKEKLFVSVFEGTKDISKDEESTQIWKRLGIPEERIFYYGAKKNWWSRSGEPENMPPGEPGGPDSEVFYDFGENFRTHENSIYKNEQCHPNCDCGRFLEIANSVFMQYQKQADGSLTELPQKNVDFGGGLERLTAAANNQPDIFQTDLFTPLIKEIESNSDKSYQNVNYKAAMRVIADHLKAATFMIAEDIVPSNKIQGYILRRLIRRAAVKMHQLNAGLTPIPAFTGICHEVIRIYPDYFDSSIVRDKVDQAITQEMDRFAKSLDKGLKEIEKQDPSTIDGKFAFDLYQTYGFPFEITQELLSQRDVYIDNANFIKGFIYNRDIHTEKSRSTSAGMFKGGLADHSETVTKLHTATHLLHAALRKFLGDHVQQTGSNITADRLRFDFSHPTKLTDADRQKIESWVNDQIKKDLPVSFKQTTLEKAKSQNALAFFGERYDAKVNVYTIGNSKTGIVSMEVCGGPHVDHTGMLGKFRLGKEEAVGAGKRRIYARLET